MAITGKNKFIRIVKENKLVNRYIHPQYMSRFLDTLDRELSRYGEKSWDSEEQVKYIVYQAMPASLCPFGFPRSEIMNVIIPSLKAYNSGSGPENSGKISKITGKVMSDSFQGSLDRMARQLPDVLIPDFVDYLEKLEAHPAVAEKYEPDWQHRHVWYGSQKQHVMGWMGNQMTHGGETFYHRDNLNISARTSYNHWNNPGMALWLLAALGEDDAAVIAAAEEAYGEQNVRRRSGIVRKHFPFDRVLELMSKDPDGEQIIIRSVEVLEEKSWRW